MHCLCQHSFLGRVGEKCLAEEGLYNAGEQGLAAIGQDSLHA